MGFQPDALLKRMDRLKEEIRNAGVKLIPQRLEIFPKWQCPGIIQMRRRCTKAFEGAFRDGAIRMDGNHRSTIGYEPNSCGEWRQQPELSEPPLNLEGSADPWNCRDDADCYSPPVQRWSQSIPFRNRR
jgi:hypothetical protein